MGVGQLEYAVKLFIEMMRNHPELCLHDCEFLYSYYDNRDSKYDRIYEHRCGICCG